MKHSLLSMILFAAVMAACGRDGTAGDGDVSGMTVSLTVGIDNASCTRAEEMKANAADEEKINSLQIVLFRNGEFYCAESSDSESVKITAEKGTYSIYAFVNDPHSWTSSSEISEDGILAAASSLSDNSLSSYVMFGYLPSFEAGEETTSATIPVNRFVSKVSIDEIHVDFSENPSYEGCSLQIGKIYLSNVLGTCPYNMIPSSSPATADLWYNRMGLEDTPESISSMTADKELDITAADGTTVSLALSYYAYPNGCASDTSSDIWEARKTRLVIEATLDGQECWYHITIPEMKPNAHYRITRCTICNIGGKSPEKHLELAPVTFTMQEDDWDSTYYVEEES